MTRPFSYLRGFLKDETGTALIPFALWTPVFLGLILASIEIGTITIRHTSMERAVEETVRELRVGNVMTATQDTLKADICARAPVLPNCEQMLKLELVQLNMTDFQAPPNTASCVDTSETISVPGAFAHGSGGDLMFVRACYMFEPITPAGSLAANLTVDDLGYSAIIVANAFVNEPR